ncbi:hypothetical protein E2562_000193 [Oryza meyeriana var. granulata]|uniref:Uncharacterized protein n=1 Tax=Oryza meyeriana var. granulata TaxID=110450 RepID=A0A6G1DC67_9ORYZ|nr:hypothetical protein E2562_000193 [Oryza meyeriana var. granulata]
MGQPPATHDYLGLGQPTTALHSVATSLAALTFLVASTSYTIYIARGYGTHLKIFDQLTLVMVSERHQQIGRQR